MIREISKRNADRVIRNVTTSDWFVGFPSKPNQSVLSAGSQEIERALQYPFPYSLPPAPTRIIKIGYVSSDFTNHPLAHLMQSVFKFHDRARFKVYCYSLSPSDNSAFRKNIEDGSDVFVDISRFSVDDTINRITSDGIHVLCNLNGYAFLHS
jgi:predicted O-linked N-acetylglucosamine transferase (SPINDLY family)